ncbi:Fumarate reductase [Fusarium oxysporum f. sp. albedinis]|nr:Fumarate reductase [Fusarium oxysporum f. sp. albedinis]
MLQAITIAHCTASCDRLQSDLHSVSLSLDACLCNVANHHKHAPNQDIRLFLLFSGRSSPPILLERATSSFLFTSFAP